jgi:hypothetical protein
MIDKVMENLSMLRISEMVNHGLKYHLEGDLIFLFNFNIIFLKREFYT